MRPQAASVGGCKLLVYAALSLTLERFILVYYYLFKLLVYEAFSY